MFYTKTVKKIKGAIVILSVIVDIFAKVVLSIIMAYLAFVILCIKQRHDEYKAEFVIANLPDAAQSLLATWITLTPGTIAFAENNKLIAHSACGNVDKEINKIIDQVRNWSLKFNIHNSS